jgi:hypothetical protein
LSLPERPAPDSLRWHNEERAPSIRAADQMGPCFCQKNSPLFLTKTSYLDG